MGFNRVTWLPGHDRSALASQRSRQLEQLREQRAKHARDNAAARQLQGSLLSLAALLDSDVTDPAGRSIGELRDVIVRWTTQGAYPPVRAIVVRTGKDEFMIGARWLEASPPSSVRLRDTHAYMSAVDRHQADVALAHDILDRQVVDASGVQIVRPADLYLAAVADRIELVGIEVGVRALLRRMGPRALRGRVRPERVIDWASISAFVPARPTGPARAGRHSEIAGAPGTGIELQQRAAEIRRLGPREVQEALEHVRRDRDGGSP